MSSAPPNQPTPAKQASLEKQAPEKPTKPQSKAKQVSFNSPLVLVPIISIALLGLNLIAGLLITNSGRESQVVISHLEALRRNRQNLEKLETDLFSYSGKITQILGILPKERNIPEFIQFIDSAAAENNSTVVLNFTSNQPTTTKDKLSVIPISLQLVTSSNDLKGFLNTIQSGKYQLRLDHIDAEFASNQQEELLVRLTGKLYVDSQFATQ